ncbi:hypothetical protein Tco_1556455, partial [Tanacetum coccineum]
LDFLPWSRVKSLDLPSILYILSHESPAKKNQFVTKSKGLTVPSEVALTKAKQIKLATKRSLIQTHSSHASGSGADEGTGSIPGVPDVLTYESDDDQISWKSSEDDDDDNEDDDDNDDDGNNDDDDYDDAENQDDDDEQTDSVNDGDDFVHPKFSTHDKEDKEEDSFDPRVQTPSHVESTDEEIQDANVEGDKMNEEETNEVAEVDVLYRDVNVNLEGRDSKMTDTLRTIVQTTQVIEDNHVIITPVNLEGQQQSSSVSSGFISNILNPSRDTGIDSLFNLNTVSTSLVDVLVTTFAEPPLLKTLENNFSKFNQTNQFVASVSLFPGIVDAYLANKMHEAVKTAIQLQSKRLRDEAQAENANFINKLDDNIKKIIKDQVKEQTSYVVAANLSKLDLKKILIDKMKSNKSIYRSDEQKNLYKALVDAYESDKLILDTYGDIVSFKRSKDDEDKDEEPSARSKWGSKRRRTGKKTKSTSAPKEKTSKKTDK